MTNPSIFLIHWYTKNLDLCSIILPGNVGTCTTHFSFYYLTQVHEAVIINFLTSHTLYPVCIIIIHHKYNRKHVEHELPVTTVTTSFPLQKGGSFPNVLACQASEASGFWQVRSDHRNPTASRVVFRAPLDAMLWLCRLCLGTQK